MTTPRDGGTLHGVRVAILVVASLGCAACGGDDSVDGGTDAGGADADFADFGFVMDARVPDGGSLDVGPGDRDTGGLRDALVDPSRCDEAELWMGPDPIVDTTTRSPDSERLSCSGQGAGATAPEQWWRRDVAAPSYVRFEVGTSGWNPVLETRTSTCGPSAVRSCSDRPPIVEIPSVFGGVFIAVEGFSAGEGPYILTQSTEAPLTTPAPGQTCGEPDPVNFNEETVLHDFGAIDGVDGCPMGQVVYFSVADPGVPFDLRVMPRGAQRPAVARVDACGMPVSDCLIGDAEEALVLRGIATSTSPTVFALGTASGGARFGSFAVTALAPGRCALDADCPLAEVCSLGACGPAQGALTVTTMAAFDVPDLGQVAVPLSIVGPGAVADVRVRVAVAHPLVDDLRITLISPDGQLRVRLRDGDDGAAADEAYGGDRGPRGPGRLRDFALLDRASGDWVLLVEDVGAGDVGQLTGAALHVFTR